MRILAFALLAALPACPIPPPPVPTPTPEPTATATPTPSPSPQLPSPSPTVAPTAFPTPTAAACAYRPLGTCVQVPREPSPFRDAVVRAQDETAAAGFVVNGKVTSEKGYTDEVTRRLRVKGLCARNGREGGHTSDDELWIQGTGESHNFDIVTGSLEPWIRLEARCALR